MELPESTKQKLIDLFPNGMLISYNPVTERFDIDDAPRLSVLDLQNAKPVGAVKGFVNSLSDTENT